MTNNKLTNNQCGICADCAPQINGGSGFNNCAEAHAAQTAGDKAAMNNKLTDELQGHGASAHISDYYMCRCPECGWFGSSEDIHGGSEICDCPNCSTEVEDLDAGALWNLVLPKLAELQEYRSAADKPIRYLNKFSDACVTLEQQPNAADDVAVYQPLFAAPQSLNDAERAELENCRNAQQVVPDVTELEAVLEWILKLPVPTFAAVPNAKRIQNAISACRSAMQSGAGPAEKCRSSENAQVVQSGAGLKDGMAALELARGMANDPNAGAMSLVPADRKQDLS